MLSFKTKGFLEFSCILKEIGSLIKFSTQSFTKYLTLSYISAYFTTSDQSPTKYVETNIRNQVNQVIFVQFSSIFAKVSFFGRENGN